MRYTVHLDDDEVDELVKNTLRQAYIDTVTVWKAQPDSKKLAANLLGGIEYFSSPQEHAAWFETVKDL